MLPLAAAVQPLPSAFATFAATHQLRSPLAPPQNALTTLLQSPHFQNLIQSQVAALQSQQLAAAAAQLQMDGKSPRTPTTVSAPPRKRVGGSTMKTAKVWRFFDELPTPEQAAECRLCRKKIKATNSSTTGMIRHLRSCHVVEYQQVQEARQSSMLLKMEEKAKVQLIREDKPKKPEEAQKSPSASSSASDTASSTASSSFVPLPPLPPLIVPQGLPAPKPMKISIKQEVTEVEETEEKAELTLRAASAFSKPEEREDDEAKKLNAQIALMMLIDQINPQMVDRNGFRQLIRFLRPGHQLPYSTTFQTQLIPEIMAQLRHFGTLFMLNNPVTNPFETLQATMSQQMPMARSSSTDEDNSSKESLDVKVEDDSDSASSADSESSMSHHVSQLMDYFGPTTKQDELQSLVTVCHGAMSYFEQRPQLLSQLSTPLLPAESSDPHLLRDLRFVAANTEAINAVIRATPEMELLPISDSQSRLLADLLSSHQ